MKMKRGKYNKNITREKRQEVLTLKEQNVDLVQISRITNINEKTIQSIKYIDRQTIYQQFEMHIIRDYFQLFIQDSHLLKMTLKQIKSFIKKKIKHQFLYETSNYQDFLQNKKQSNRQRILSKVVDELSNRIKQHINHGDDYLNCKMIDDQQLNNQDFEFELFETYDNHLEQEEIDFQESYQFSQNQFFF